MDTIGRDRFARGPQADAGTLARRQNVLKDAEATACMRQRLHDCTDTQACTFAALYHHTPYAATFAEGQAPTWQRFAATLETGWDGEGPEVPPMPHKGMKRLRGNLWSTSSEETANRVVAAALTLLQERGVGTFGSLAELAKVVVLRMEPKLALNTVLMVLEYRTTPTERRYLQAHTLAQMSLRGDKAIPALVFWPLFRESPRQASFLQWCGVAGNLVGVSGRNVYRCIDASASQAFVDAIREVYPTAYKNWVPRSERE